MEVIFSELKQKEVINIADGRHLGKVCDLAFAFPEGKISGFTVTGCKGIRLTRQEVFLPLKCVVKIGEDAVLVNLNGNPPSGNQNCPPPPSGKPNCPPPQQSPGSRRSLDEYE